VRRRARAARGTHHAGKAQPVAQLTSKQVFATAAWRHPALSSIRQAGLFPLLFAAAVLGLGQIGALPALYPAVWRLAQLVTGASSERLGGKRLIVSGMWLRPVALALVAAAGTCATGALAAVLLSLGTPMSICASLPAADGRGSTPVEGQAVPWDMCASGSLRAKRA
jgi:hypothetical protein